jgi:hypothetical protein
VKAAARVGLLDRSESRVLGSAVVVVSVVAVVVNMVAWLVEGVVVLGGSTVAPAGDGAIMEVSLVLGGGGGSVGAGVSRGRVHGGGQGGSEEAANG